MVHTPLYQTSTVRPARRRRRRLTLLVVGLAAFAIVGAGLGQGLVAMRGTAGSPVEGFGERGRGRDVSVLLPPTPTPAPPTPTAPAPTPALPAAGAPASGIGGTADLHRRAVAAEAVLRTGRLQATYEYGNGARSSATIDFDLGGGAAGQPARRLHLVQTYRGATGSRTSEYALAGDRSWQRQPDGRWVAATIGDDLWRQLQLCLPHVGAAAAPESTGVGTLRWRDLQGDADVQLTVEPATGTPQRLRRVERRTGLVVDVTFDGWNTPVAIASPEGR